jgi:hypothetical protein
LELDRNFIGEGTAMRTVHKWIVIALLVSSAAACGGGGGSGGSATQPPPVNNQNPAGIWFGNVFNANSATSWEVIGITLSSGESRFIDELGTQYIASINVVGTNFSGTVFAIAPLGSRFIDGNATATGTISGTITQRARLSGSYSLSTGEQGTLNLFYDSNYERTSSLSKTSGMWIDAASNVYSVDADGSIFGQDSSGCVYGGRISIINPAVNAYRVQLTVANCGVFNGTYSGLGTLSDFQLANDDRLFTYQVNNDVWALTSRVAKL